MASAYGTNGSVTFDGSFVRIVRTRHVGTFLNQGVQGDRHLLARALTAIEFQSASRGKAGFISFEFPGRNPPRGGVFDAMADENAVIFAAEHEQQFRAVHHEILTFMGSHGQAATMSQPASQIQNESDQRLPAPLQSKPSTKKEEPPLSAVWLDRSWDEGRYGWKILMDEAFVNGWNATVGVGVMDFVHRRTQHSFRAFSVDEAVSKFRKFYETQGNNNTEGHNAGSPPTQG